jgi:hypothetical protein
LFGIPTRTAAPQKLHKSDPLGSGQRVTRTLPI